MNTTQKRVQRCKGTVIALSACCVLGLAGCASNGMAINTMGGNKVDRAFIEGRITKQQKVIIADTEVAALTGAGIGAAGGAAVGGIANGGKGALTGGLLGAVAGGVTGAFIGKEIEAYQTTIKGDDGQEYNGYLAKKLENGQCAEFTVVDGKLKNVNTIACKIKNVSGFMTGVNEIEGKDYRSTEQYNYVDCNVNAVIYINTNEILELRKGQCKPPKPVTTSSPVKKQSAAASQKTVVQPKKEEVVKETEKPAVVVPQEKEASLKTTEPAPQAETKKSVW